MTLWGRGKAYNEDLAGLWFNEFNLIDKMKHQ